MTNDETRMTNEIRNSNDETESLSSLIIRASSFIRHYVVKPRPLAVDALRLCRSDVKNVCT
jgi:hypothetical protein